MNDGKFETERYNTKVRQAISDAYVDTSKEKSKLSVRLWDIVDSLENNKDTMTYSEYVALRKEAADIEKQIERLSIELDVWDRAREICLNVADEGV